MNTNTESDVALLDVCETLCNAIRRNDPTSTLLPVLEQAREGDDPDLAKMREAIAMFYERTHPDEQRRLLGGWKPCPVHPDVAIVSRECGLGQVRRVLDMECGPELVASHDHAFIVDEGIAPVRVWISEGLSQKDVVLSLLNAIELLVNEFEKMVSDLPKSWVYKE